MEHWGLTVPEWVQVVVATCTLLLAIATVVLALFTRKMALEAHDEVEAVRLQLRVAQNQLQVGEAAHRAAIMPWLVAASAREASIVGTSPWPMMSEEDSRQIEGQFAVSNIGNGLAVIPADGIRVLPSSRSQAKVAVGVGFPVTPSIAVSGSSLIRFAIPKEPIERTCLTIRQFTNASPNATGEFFADVTYTDATGGQPVRARFHFVEGEERDLTFFLHGVSYFRQGEPEPFARTESNTFSLVGLSSALEQPSHE